MKNSQTQAIVIIILIILIGAFAFIWSDRQKNVNEVVVNTPNVPEESQVASVQGCYVAESGNNVFTLNINQQSGENVSGTLNIVNAEKDSSKGTVNGTFKNDILLADYTFNSEGSTSVMQVAFKKSGNDFIRGYSNMDAEGTHFVDVANIAYDASSVLSVFKKEACQ